MGRKKECIAYKQYICIDVTVIVENHADLIKIFGINFQKVDEDWHNNAKKLGLLKDFVTAVEAVDATSNLKSVRKHDILLYLHFEFADDGEAKAFLDATFGEDES